ncbi:hypothetical protein GG804_13025 [Sphingomonas histidinilytica]|uniref:hypothetical protein n=1 Tax=Rhizorhabdus histidinilytica TaxID=439228 RepID=UPI001ADB99FE|nr:hypothetical protein [Rhizorhabdus histidinilytica]MBO9377692.1 hypothetical protein [Rhizorhabdus histidinilytica]
MAAGLRRLEALPPPPLAEDRSTWGQIAADALRLARDGWLELALSRGWTPADVLGVGAQGSHYFEGLAVWLRGRPLILLDATTAIAANEGAHRSVFNRPDRRPRPAGLVVVPLWKFGRR